jgi:hypothetical protein
MTLSECASKTTKLFIGRDTPHNGEGYLSNYDMILCVTQAGDDFTIAELSERVNARFGQTSRKSLENVLNRAVKRGEFIKIRGRANLYRRSSS